MEEMYTTDVSYNDDNNTNKSKNKTVIVSAILLTFLIFLGRYIVYDKFLKETEPKTEEKEGNEDKEELDVQEVLLLDDPVVKDLYHFVKNKGYPLLDNYFHIQKDITLDNFDNAKKYEYAFQFLNTNDIKHLETEFGNISAISITNKAYDDALKRAFGENVNIFKNQEYRFIDVRGYGPDKLNYGGIALRYDQEENIYRADVAGIGGVRPGEIQNNAKLIEAYKQNDKLVLVEKFIYGGVDFNNDGQPSGYVIYKDQARKEEIDKSSFNSEVTESNAMDTLTIDRYLDKASAVEFTFKLDDKTNNYYFFSSKIIDNYIPSSE